MNKQRRPGRFNALDDLLPGPTEAEAAALREHTPPPPRRPVGRNALDDLLPGPDPGPQPEMAPPVRTRRPRSQPAASTKVKKVWVSVEVPADVMRAVHDAVAALSGPPVWMTMGDLAERALRSELDRLAAEHNGGHPFPHQSPDD